MSPKVGSLGAFWPLLEPVLDALAPRRLCEVGVEGGAFASQLLAWCARRDCSYIGIDPDPPADLAALAARGELAGAMIRGTSHEELPGLEACDAYFLDGDHNYYTMRGELDAIAARVDRDGRPGPLICAHDVAWPWARRDMYYAPDRIPLEHRHAYSERLGVVAGSDDLVDGGLRDPGRYAIACRPGGPRNGVLTAVEDFVASARATGAQWELTLVPVAFGLAVLYRPETLSEACRVALRELRAALAPMTEFLRVLDDNYITLYLFGEEMRGHTEGLQRHIASLDEHGAALQRAYDDLSTHAASLLREYELLRDHCEQLERARATGDAQPAHDPA